MRRGLTLVEVLIAILILALGALALTATSIAVARSTSRNSARYRGEIAARDSIERARSREH